MRIPAVVSALVFSLVLVSCGGAADVAAPAGQVIELLTPADAAAYLSEHPEAVLLDVRTPEEFAEGHLEGAVNIDFYADNFADVLLELDKEADYVVYCRTGNRSGQTTSMMEDLGFASVHDVGGGIVDWLNAGVPTGGF